MSVLSDLFSVRTLGESDRLDYVIGEHDKLTGHFKSLVEMLEAKGVLAHDEVVRLTATSEPTAIPKS